ncbi:MAG: rhodanese-like domain-containing protein [Planctomycetota bacterium]|jgi:rhodanese-related sulfurtransferase
MMPDANVVMELEVKYMRNLRMGWAVLIIIAVVVVVVVAAKLYVSRGADVSQAQLLERMEQKSDVCILDVRTVREYNSGHIPGAINIGHKDISANLGALKPYVDKDVVVYCELGVRARTAQRTLAKLGFLHVYHLTGDMAAWRDTGLATEAAGTGAE